MFSRLLLNVKYRSRATLNAWSYQCESILAQRSRRIQQLFTFYHRVYGVQGLKQIFRSYRRQLQPPLRGVVLSAVASLGLHVSDVSHTNFNWDHERLSLKNFDVCHRDIEFIDTLPSNKLCPLCKQKNMRYCYCLLGNQKCKSPNGGESMRSCRKALDLPPECGPEGNALITSADENMWEPYMAKNEFSIWRREEQTQMYAYKVYARFDDITASDLLHVQTDLNYRRQWDESAVRLELIEEDSQPNSNSHLIYWELQWPKLFANRDYVYCRRYVTEPKRKVMMVCSKGTKHQKYPANSNKVRVTDYWSFMVIKPYRNFDEPGVHYIVTYYDDPGLPIPQSIKSWVTQKQMPDFLKKMYMATKQYSCRDALEMRKIHQLRDFQLQNDDYTANESRTSWFRYVWRSRDRGE